MVLKSAIAQLVATVHILSGYCFLPFVLDSLWHCTFQHRALLSWWQSVSSHRCSGRCFHQFHRWPVDFEVW